MKRCGLCGRSFIDQQALQQHIRDSPAHTSFRCEPCNRVFKSQEDLEKHLRDSPAHAKPFRCEPCNRVFKSQEDLEKHLRDSPAHTGPFYCTLCRRTFKSKDGLDQHAKFSTIHNVPPPATPLDLFFGSFQGFQYDAKSSPSQVYAQLVMHHGWQKHDENEKSAWERYQSALQEELVLWFGAENDLSSWHSLCRAIDIEPLPSTCAQGAKVMRDVYVNIIDLLEWARNGREGPGVRKFSGLKELRAYTRSTKRIFANNLHKGDEGKNNAVLRHLLRFIFRR